MYNILVCDDEKDIVSALRIYLTAEGYRVFEAGNGAEALEVIDREDIHLALLDVMMPGMDGITALNRLREHHNLPVILLTAKSEDTDKVLGLNVGADDYVTKPFNPVELLARVRSQLRRYLQFGGGQPAPSAITVGAVTIDDDAQRVTVDGEPVSLTPREYDILKFLMYCLSCWVFWRCCGPRSFSRTTCRATRSAEAFCSLPSARWGVLSAWYSRSRRRGTGRGTRASI